MYAFKINGGKKLMGTITIKGAKNATLPLLICSLLTKETVTIHNVSQLSDIKVLIDILKGLGTDVKIDNDTIYLTTSEITNTHAPYELLSKMRAGFWVIGPLLGRMAKAHVSLPGGCALGARKLDIYFSALEAMGAKIEIEGGYVSASGTLHGAEIVPHRITVGGTITILMAAVLTKGTTIIHNAAMEPEVVDVENMLVKMGAKIQGIGTNTLTIEGVDELKGAEWYPVPDRIETATFAIATAMTKGNVILKGARLDLMEHAVDILKNDGVIFTQLDEGIQVDATHAHLSGQNIQTAEYPDLATDDQPCLTAMSCIATGNSSIVDGIYDNRFMHVPELQRMGAHIDVIDNQSIVVCGVDHLTGATVTASDLRGGAALILAGLVAKGETTVQRIYHVDRGYYKMEEKLTALGADVKRIWQDYP